MVVFTGPTLSAEDGAAELEATYLGPVSQGDVYRASLLRPDAIGIIDGFFERIPAVWHKEILWAMREGIHVFGSASMGALRAAELAAFGMVGVGAVFEAYADGTLEDDDEVAVTHGFADTEYRALSEAMVNVRRVLADAQAAGVISDATRTVLRDTGKALFYPQRSYPRILELAAERGCDPTELEDLKRWLPTGRVDQKREDAIAMLQAMKTFLEGAPGPKTVRYSFEFTDMWEALVCDASEGSHGGEEQSVLLDLVLDELRLEVEPYRQLLELACARLLAIDEASREGLAPRADAVQQTADTFRRERGLLEPRQVDGWLAENELDTFGFTRLMEDETRVRWVAGLARARALRLVPDYLRVTGRYGPLMTRVRDKQRRLKGRGLEHPSLAALGLERDAVLRWYFEQRLGRAPAEDVGRHAELAGFVDEAAFVRAVLREYCYCVQLESSASEPR